MRSEPGTGDRNSRRGAILLEALIAFALLAAFATIALRTLSTAALDQSDRAQIYWLAEFARSKAEELAVKAERLPASGTANEDWAWAATESRISPDGKSRFDADIALYQVTIEVAARKHPEVSARFETVFARSP